MFVVASPRRTLLTAAGIAAATCTVGVGGLAVFAWVTNEAGPAREVTEAFVADLAAGDHAEAYDRLCGDTRDRFSPEAFESYVGDQRQISHHRVVGAEISRVDRRRTGLVTVEFGYGDAGTARHTFQLVEEDDTWRVCGDPY